MKAKSASCGFIEKPDQPQTLDSDLMAVGPLCAFSRHLGGTGKNRTGRLGLRIQLTDAIAELAKKQSVDAMLMTGDSYDCGKIWATCRHL